ncbi:MAG TPA: DUF1707 domain-containing protein [Jiangellaceae bacterium]
MTGGNGSGETLRLRASDADRERIRAVLDQARADGRIDDAELARRVSRLASAATYGELDDLVDDLPPQPPPPVPLSRRLAAWGATLAAAVVIGGGFAWLVTRGGDDPVERPAGPPAAAEEVEAPAAVDMFAPGEVTRMLDALAAEGYTAFSEVAIWPDNAVIKAQVSPEALQYDEVRYRGGEITEATPGGTVFDGYEVFAAADFDPEVIASIAARAAAVAGADGRAVSTVQVSRSSTDGHQLEIWAHLESDAYGSAPVVVWDATGQHLLEDGSS